MDLRDCHLPVDRVSAGTWLGALLGGTSDLAVHPLFVGTRHRSDGWSCLDRRVDGHWILLVLEGRCDGQAGGVPLVLEPGSAMWLSPGVRHTLRWSQRLRYAEVYFAVTARQTRAGRVRRVHVTPHGRAAIAADADPLRPPLDRLADEVQLGGAFRQHRLRSLLAVACIDLMRLARVRGGGGEGPARAGRNAARLTRAQQSRLLQWTRERGHSASPAELAACLGLSPDYFSRSFRNSFGVSPRVWLNRRRIDTAAGLLDQSDLPVFQIADQLGYAGVAQFSRQFKRVTGTSPVAYRRRSHHAGDADAPAHLLDSSSHERGLRGR